jgi:hypothetical protein
MRGSTKKVSNLSPHNSRNYGFLDRDFVLSTVLAFAINAQNRVSGLEAVCFGLNQVFGSCSAIDRD